MAPQLSLGPPPLIGHVILLGQVGYRVCYSSNC
jgi:hypothetical protein